MALANFDCPGLAVAVVVMHFSHSCLASSNLGFIIRKGEFLPERALANAMAFDCYSFMANYVGQTS